MLKLAIYTFVMSTIYLISGIISLSIFHENTPITMSAFFPEGFALAAVLLFGKRILPGIFIGQLLLAYYSHFPLGVGIGISIGNTLEAYIAYKIFKYFELNSHMLTLKDFFGLFFSILFILQPISVVFGNISLYLNNILQLNELPRSMFFWWIGNVLGQILLTPVLLLLYHNRKELHIKPIVMVILTIVVFNYFFQVVLEIHNTSLLLIVTLPAAIYLATINITYAAISSMLLASISLYFAQNNIGTFSHNPSQIDNILNLNYFMISHILLVLLVGILFREKEKGIHILQSMAHYDYLTGLPNRHLLREEIHHTVYLADYNDQKSAICFIDIDGFKEVNDTFGHNIGDKVLSKIVERVKVFTKSEDAFLRIGGDEFLIIFNQIVSKEEVSEKLNKILMTVSKSMSIDEHEINISFSIGVAYCPEHGKTVEALMNASDDAMYEAKRKGKNQFLFAEL